VINPVASAHPHRTNPGDKTRAYQRKSTKATHPNLIEYLHRQIPGVLWRLVSSGDGTGGKTSIYLLQGLLGAAISPLYV